MVGGSVVGRSVVEGKGVCIWPRPSAHGDATDRADKAHDSWSPADDVPVCVCVHV